LGKNIDDDNVFYLLEIVQQYSCSKLNQECAEYLAENFGDMLKKDKLMGLEVDTWVEMLKSDDIQVHTEEDVFDAVLRYADQFDLKKRLEVLEKTLPHVRFQILSSQFLVEKVENNPKLNGVNIIHQLLHETYRYKAYPSGNASAKTKPRKGSIMWDNEGSPDVEISGDKFTAKNTQRQNTWTNARCMPPFIEGISYREFKVTFSSYLMVGVETKDNFSKNLRSYNQYPGQTPNGWSWYSAGQTYHANQCVQAQSPFISGDTVGVLLDSNEGKIAFYKNREVVTASFASLPKNVELCAVVSFYNTGDTATIIPGRSLPTELPSGWVGSGEKKKRGKKLE